MARRFYPSDCVSLNPTSVLSRVLVATVLGKKKENAAPPFIPIIIVRSDHHHSFRSSSFIPVKTMPFISGSALRRAVVGEHVSQKIQFTHNIALNMKHNI